MNFKELCQARFSCRAFEQREIETEKQEYIKECVRLAPSAVNRQPWLFYWITDEPHLQAVKTSYHRDWINDVPAIILCCKNEAEAWTRRYDTHNHADIDIAIAIEHLCLAATEQGLATCWVCNFNREELFNQFEIPDYLEPVVIIPIGYPADEPKEKQRKSMDELMIKLAKK